MSASDAPLNTSLISHLLELRLRLIRAIAGFALIALCLLPFSARLYAFVALPFIAQLPAHAQGMIATHPAGALIAPIKVVAYLSALVSAPWVVYQLWAFIAPGLYQREKRTALPILFSAIVLFYVGAAFAYRLVLPGVFHFLAVFKPDVITLAPDAAAYLDFVLTIALAFGVCFELPVALVILSLLGLIRAKQLRLARGYAVVAVFIVAAILTPPDVVSQLMLAVPMCLLYEISIVIIHCIERRPGADSAAALYDRR